MSKFSQKFKNRSFLCSENRSKAAQVWLDKNEKVSEIVSNIFEKNYPELAKKHQNILKPKDHKLHNFSMVALNCNFSSGPHYDRSDAKVGFCCIVSSENLLVDIYICSNFELLWQLNLETSYFSMTSTCSQLLM
jgi:hypothetical protein